MEENKEGNLEPVLLKGEAAPLKVRDLTHLYCRDENCTITRNCHCLTSGLFCTELCSCCKSESTCSNVQQYPTDKLDDEHSDDDAEISDDD